MDVVDAYLPVSQMQVADFYHKCRPKLGEFLRGFLSIVQTSIQQFVPKALPASRLFMGHCQLESVKSNTYIRSLGTYRQNFVLNYPKLLFQTDHSPFLSQHKNVK